MGVYRWLAAAGVLALATGGVALATGAERADGAVPDALLTRLYPGTTVEQYVAQLASMLRQADRAGDGLDADDVALARAQEVAHGRAAAVGQVLAYDLDGDLLVTRAEVTRGAPGEQPARGRIVDALMDRFDADGDDRITMAEAVGNAAPSRGGEGLEVLLALDPNHDGRITAAELATRAERAFRRIDRDGDGKLSREEYEAVSQRIRDAQVAINAPVCALPPVPAGTRVIAYTGYDADALANVAVGGPDQETNLLDVAIEPGREPLYLVLTSYASMVWRLSGATDRVARVVVSSAQAARRMPAVPVPTIAARAVVANGLEDAGGMSASGVIGLPAERVTIVNRNCPGYASDAGNVGVKASLRRSLGRVPDRMVASYSAQRVSLPSGIITKAAPDAALAPTGFDPTLWREATRFWPGGLARVDAAQVVAKVRVAPYQVLPSQMGLAQLVGEGTATRADDGIRVVRPIAHMPPGMGGAHSTTLTFARGVPVPPGDPVHSCIRREDSGEATGAACRMRR